MTRLLSVLLCVIIILAPGQAPALDAIVRKAQVRIPNFAFESGETIPELKLGVEAYGRLNATRDNVVLIAHFLAGDSHAAGRYARTDRTKGWWDALIGRGKAIDTDRFYVVCTDLPAAMKVKTSTVVTTGPATIDPRTGRRYELSFPKITVRDCVAAQKKVLDALQVRELAAVTGPSMGGMIAWQWAIEHPAYVKRAIPVGAPVTFTRRERQGFEAAKLVIQSDPSWAFGSYANFGIEPLWGIAMALQGLSVINAGRAWELPRLLPSLIQRARRFDANHYIRNLELHADYDLGKEHGSRATAFRRVRAQVTVIGFDDDRFITPTRLRSAGAELTRAGVTNRVRILRGTNGHLSVLEDLDVLSPAMRAALR